MAVVYPPAWWNSLQGLWMAVGALLHWVLSGVGLWLKSTVADKGHAGQMHSSSVRKSMCSLRKWKVLGGGGKNQPCVAFSRGRNWQAHRPVRMLGRSHSP